MLYVRTGPCKYTIDNFDKTLLARLRYIHLTILICIQRTLQMLCFIKDTTSLYQHNDVYSVRSDDQLSTAGSVRKSNLRDATLQMYCHL